MHHKLYTNTMVNVALAGWIVFIILTKDKQSKDKYIILFDCLSCIRR